MSTSWPSAAATARSSSRASALPAVRTCSSRVTWPSDDVQERLHLQGLPDGGPRSAHATPTAQVLERVDVEVDRGGGRAPFDDVRHLGRIGPRAGGPRSADRCEPQSHGDRPGVHDGHRHLALLRCEERRLVRRGHGGGQGGDDDLGGTGLLREGVGLQEAHRRGPGRGHRVPVAQGVRDALRLGVLRLVERLARDDHLHGDDVDAQVSRPAGRQVAGRVSDHRDALGHERNPSPQRRRRP